MNKFYQNIINLNTSFKWIDFLIFLIGFIWLNYISINNFLTSFIVSIITIIFIIYLGRIFVSLMLLLISYSCGALLCIINYIISFFNPTNNLIKFKYIINLAMIASSMVIYGIICICIYSYNFSVTVKDFYPSLCILYGIIMAPTLIIHNNDSEEKEVSFNMFGAFWNFFYRIAFIFTLIMVALFHINIYTIIIITVTIIAYPVVLLHIEASE